MVHSIGGLVVVDRDHSLQRLGDLHNPFVAVLHILLVIAVVDHHIRPVDHRTGQETAGYPLVQLMEALVEAFHRIEGNKQMEYLGILELDRFAGYILGLVEILQGQLVPCLYPTVKKLADTLIKLHFVRTLHFNGRPLTL